MERYGKFSYCGRIGSFLASGKKNTSRVEISSLAKLSSQIEKFYNPKKKKKKPLKHTCEIFNVKFLKSCLLSSGLVDKKPKSRINLT